ncbi:MAG: cysteine synthase A [Bacteroidales bacterium]|nr:cysteine synthase A [Bacteroidales bacterium]
MARIFNDLTELVGNTPLVRINKITEGLDAQVIAKIESFNPGGSAKDRVGIAMIEAAERSGQLRPGGTIIEPTSGNTGVGLAWVSVIKGYKLILTMPDTMSLERRNLLEAMGATIFLTPGAEGMAGSIKKAEEILAATDNAIIPGQFENPANPEAHVKTTAEEIWRDTDGKVDIFVAGVGSAGTISGTGKGLKSHNPNIKIVAVEPASSPVITKGKWGAHKIQGIGANFVPANYHAEYVDEVMTVSDDDAINTTVSLAHKEGILVGISSGAAMFAAMELAKRPENKGKMIVAFLPDTGERYLSTGIYK